MKYSNSPIIRIAALAALLCMASGGSTHSQEARELHHTTMSDFSPGSFFQTILGGLENSPEISLDSYFLTSVIFDDDTIGAWAFDTNEPGNIAEEDPDGWIHLRADYQSNDNGSWSYAQWDDITIPDMVAVEYHFYADSIDSSGVTDPFTDQPTGSSCRLDILRTDLGFRVEIFRDRMVSFYREGDTGIDYPVTANIDMLSEPGHFYSLRFECDFTDPDLPVQVYSDGMWIGELKADFRNGKDSPSLRILAFSRSALCGASELHVDRVRAESLSIEHYSSGTYTSDILELNASSLDTFTWTAVPSADYPWGEWVKYTGNPIIMSASLPENMLADIGDPMQQPIMYDDKYWLCYSSGGPGQSVHLAYTADPGLLSWTDYESNPVLAPDAGETYLFSPHIFLCDGTWYLFYDLVPAGDSHQRIAYATAASPTGPWTRGQVVLERGASGEWDDYRVAEPFVVKEGDTYYLFHMGNHNTIGGTERIGIATTPDSLFPLGPEVDGSWTKQGFVFSPTGIPGDWDSGLVSNPSLVKSGQKYFMRYSGSTDNIDWQTGVAWAVDPVGPWHRSGQPDITYGPPGSWDALRVLRGAINYHDGKWYSLYAGNDGSGGWDAYRGGIAAADPRIEEDPLAFETRTSSDGITWEEWRAVPNGGLIQSSPDKFFQYRTDFSLGDDYLSPILTGVWLDYVYEIPTGEKDAPPALRMYQPFPNPFNPSTAIRFSIDRRRRVRLEIYDVSGARIAMLADDVFDSGLHEVFWNGRNSAGRRVASGIYFARMQTEIYTKTKRLVLLR